MPLNIVFWRPQKWSRLKKTLLLKHYYRRQGRSNHVLHYPSTSLAQGFGRQEVTMSCTTLHFLGTRLREIQWGILAQYVVTHYLAICDPIS